jgi:hypothetical protein
VEDENAGKPIPQVNSSFQVVIPDSGVLKVRSTKPFEIWHSEIARFEDGTRLQTEEGKEPPNDAVALRGGSYTSLSKNGREIRFLSYFVGTKQAAHEFLEMPSSPPGY